VDGDGNGFGATSVQTVSADQGSVSAYGALRNSKLLTLILINKTSGDLLSPIEVAGQTANVKAKMYRYSNADLTAIQDVGKIAFTAGAASVTVPAYSMNLLEIPLK
jgi:hypothetical protein